MRSWNGECSRAFTDWRGLHRGVLDAGWLDGDAEFDRFTDEPISH
jgi:hypothetical protein